MKLSLHHNVLVAVISYNEGEKLKRLVKRFPTDRNYHLVFIDDGSTDGSVEWLESAGHHVIRNKQNSGVGASIRKAIAYGRDQELDIVVIMAANGKMLPDEIPRLVEPILENRADYVQGSRYLKGGQKPNLPLFRDIAIKLFTLLINLVLGFKGTDITCGFRAYRLKLFDDPNINLDQDWLNRYEMEYYIHYQAFRNGYRIMETPISMVYPDEKRGYSKIKPFTGWWSMLRPWVYLIFGIKK